MLQLNPELSGDNKFIADVHLGGLAKYLRLCGFDTLYRMSLSDGEIIRLSLAENRIILTCDKELLKNKHIIYSYRIISAKPVEQLREVMKRYDLINNLNPFTRCMECNAEVVNVTKKEIEETLQPKTRNYYNEFKKCTGCGKIYWEGSHYERMKIFVDSLISSHQSAVTNNQ
jgi:uncharacterized protein with PIN domain